MLYNHKTDPENNYAIQQAFKYIDLTTSADHFKQPMHGLPKTKVLELHHIVRDELMTGAELAFMLQDAITDKQVARNLINYVEYNIDGDLSNTEFATVFDTLRQAELDNNNGKSKATKFWGRTWGVYADWMLKTAKIRSQQKTIFNSLFKTTPLK